MKKVKNKPKIAYFYSYFRHSKTSGSTHIVTPIEIF